MLIFSSRAYLLAWETGRRPVVMSGAKVLGWTWLSTHGSGSEFEARRVLGSAAFLPGSALSDGTSSVPRSGSRDRRGGLANPLRFVTGRSTSCQRARRTTLTQVRVVALQHFFTKWSEFSSGPNIKNTSTPGFRFFPGGQAMALPATQNPLGRGAGQAKAKPGGRGAGRQAAGGLRNYVKL